MASCLSSSPVIGPLVSVIIPAYKKEWLGEAIKSVLEQSYRNLELVIVNDCSPEDIQSVVMEFDDDRIKYYYNERNIGGKNLVEQWNRCVNYAEGEWLCLLADDDKYMPLFLSDLLALTQKYPQCDVFRSRVEIIDRYSSHVSLFPSSPEYETAEDYLWHVLNHYRRQTISEFMLRTDIIRKCGGYVYCPLAWGSDFLSILQFATLNGIVSSTKVNVQYRDSGENISSNKDKYLVDKLKATSIKYSKMDNWIKEHVSDFSKSQLIELAKREQYDSKHFLLNNASFRGLCMVFSRCNEIESVSGVVILEKMISLVFNRINDFFFRLYISIKNLLKKTRSFFLQNR